MRKTTTKSDLPRFDKIDAFMMLDILAGVRKVRRFACFLFAGIRHTDFAYDR